MSSENNVVHPKVLEAYSTDVRKSIARLDEKSMNILDIKEDDIVEIQAKRKTVAKCKKFPISEDSADVIRIDGLIRNNAGAEIGDTITVSKTRAYPAQEITVRPLEDQAKELQKISRIEEQYFADCLEGVPLVHNDTITIPYYDGQLFFNVVETFPVQVPIEISKETVFHIVGLVNLRDNNYNELLDIIKKRYAKGEISKEEYDVMKEDLK